jgi:tetratricopeptide (TPR) repeat protein
MVIDERADHSMRVPRPDLTEALGSPNACNGCHADQTTAWAAQAVQRWYPQSAHRGPHFGEVLHAARGGAANAPERLLTLAADRGQPAIARATALDALTDHAQAEQLLTMQRLLADEDALVRAAAVRWLEHTDLRTRVDQAWPLLEDPARTVRLEAARVLAPLARQGLPEKFRKQLDRAFTEYVQAQEVNAERPEAQLNLGLIAAAQGKPLEAEATYQAALRLDRTFSPAYVNLADLYRQYGRDADGEQVLRRGITAVPDDAALRYALGLQQVRQQHLEGALESLERAVALAPAQTRYRYVYALALQRQGELTEAVRELETILRNDARHRDARVALVEAYRELGNGAMARLHLNQLRQQNPEDPAIDVLSRQLDP